MTETKLTIQSLKNMKPGEMIATGTGTYLELIGQEIRWIAVRGLGMHDWAIYYHLICKSIDFIRCEGDKIFSESIIKRLVPCTDEAFNLYRY